MNQETSTGSPPQLLRRMFDAAIASAQPALCVPPHLPTRAELGSGRLIVIGAGKASAAMARAVEQHWDGPLQGLLRAAAALCGVPRRKSAPTARPGGRTLRCCRMAA